MDGALLIDKPAGLTSHDAVAVVRRVLGERRVGHLGTLDPFATGLLVLLLGKATRLARFYAHREKVYEGAIRFGFSTDTYDATGRPVSPEQQVVTLDEEELRRAFARCEGSRLQTPPAFSAKKIAGVPAYRLARRGSNVCLDPVPVVVQRLELRSISGPLAEFTAVVSAGTYIRSLAHELGQAVGVGAHLASLRRTRVGEFTLEAAVRLDELARYTESRPPWFVPLESLLPEFPVVSLSAEDAAHACNGIDVAIGAGTQDDWVRLFSPGGGLCAIGRRIATGIYHPEIVFATSLAAEARAGNRPPDHDPFRSI